MIENFNHENLRFISSIEEHLKQNNTSKEPPFGMAYIIRSDHKIVGYFYISPIKNEKVELEYAILKEERGKGYSSLILKEITNYLCSFQNIKELYLDIDPSNSRSINCALSADYYPDYDDYENKHYQGKLLFRKENSNYISKRRK